MDLLEEARRGNQCLLIKGAGQIVAHLDFRGTDDFPWIVFRFRPLSDWYELGQDREVFSGDQGLKIRDAIEARIMAIQRLDLWLSTVDRRILVGDFLLSLGGDLAYFRSHARGQSIQWAGASI
jgi:hypothetical protein